MKDLHRNSSTVFLEVLTEKLFGWHDCMFVTAYFKVRDIRTCKDSFNESERDACQYSYFVHILNANTILYYFSFSVRYRDHIGIQ